MLLRPLSRRKSSRTDGLCCLKKNKHKTQKLLHISITVSVFSFLTCTTTSTRTRPACLPLYLLSGRRRVWTGLRAPWRSGDVFAFLVSLDFPAVLTCCWPLVLASDLRPGKEEVHQSAVACRR